MVQRIRHILERFPEDEALVRQLVRDNREFDALCQEYANTTKELESLPKPQNADSADQANALRKRCTEIEEQILTMIEGYRPV
ncbi:MAG: hypothetical protein JO110_04420 [Acetobacteraceae bacterium]|nr:hypothetical protein [Acetobacteraceae bacterium]